MEATNDGLDIVKLIIKRNFNDSTSISMSDADEFIRRFATVTHCRLDREHLTSVPIIDFLPCLTNLYLQCNQIEEMSNFSILTGLRFLTLSENRIAKIKGIKDLPRLGFLDVTENRITSLDFSEFPDSLVILNISDNPCSEIGSFMDDVIQHLPKLKSLDGQSINVTEDTSSSESDGSSIEEEVKESNQPNPQMKKQIQNDSYDDLSAQINDSFQNFVNAMNEREKQLENDFTVFTSISQSTAKRTEMSDQEIAALEKEVANISVVKPIDASKKLVPRPPVGSKNKATMRNRPVSGSANTIKVRAPGARPFRRTVR